MWGCPPREGGKGDEVVQPVDLTSIDWKSNRDRRLGSRMATQRFHFTSIGKRNTRESKPLIGISSTIILAADVCA